MTKHTDTLLAISDHKGLIRKAVKAENKKLGRPVMNINLDANSPKLHADVSGIRLAFNVNGPKSVQDRTAVLEMTLEQVAAILPRLQKACQISSDLAKLHSIDI